MTEGLIRRAAVLCALACLFSAPSGATDLIEQYTRAREFDPTFQAARLDRQVAEAVLRESKAGRLPVLSANLSASRTDQDIRESDNLLFQEGKTDFFSEDYGLSLTQPVYRQDSFQRIPQAAAEVRQAVALVVAAEQDLMYRVAEAHFRFLAARDALELAEAERIAIQRQLEEAEERLESGLAPITDVHDARARFALAQGAEIDARDVLEDERLAIAEITGVAPPDLQVLGEGFPLTLPDNIDDDAWVEAALFQNPAIKAREAALEVAVREVRRQKAERLPQVDLVANYSGRDSGGSIFLGGGGNEIRTTDVALRVSVPLFDGGRVSARARQAVFAQQRVAQELELERRRVERETRNALRGVMNGITRVDAFQKSVFSNEAAVALKEEGLRSGINTGLEVLDARRDLFFAKNELAEARYLYILNSLRLKRAAGTLSLADLESINAYLQ